jgi:tRNA pseudouridine55 synthase
MTTASTPDGLLLVDKPAGVSSHDVVLAARRALHERRIGHAGTLDPFATGLLVLLVGRATRLLPYLPGDPKVYEASIVFGAETDTEDLLGQVTMTAPLPSRAAVLAALPALTGHITHVPPAFSAKHVGGRRAYAVARSGGAVTLEPVAIRVDGWIVRAWEGDDTAVSACAVEITCGAGTYVRALARDLARSVTSAGHLRALRRVRSGPFDVADGATLGDLRDGAAVLRPAVDAVPGLPRQTISDKELLAVVRGVEIDATIAGDLAALVNRGNGALVALGERHGERWQPRVVMRPALSEPADP